MEKEPRNMETQEKETQANKMTRREMAAWLGRAGLALSAGSLLGTSASAAEPPVTKPVAAPTDPMRLMDAEYGVPTGPPQQVAMLVYPQMAALDLVGPQTMLASLMNIDIHLVWKNTHTLTTDTGIGILPSTTFANCPDDLTVLLVPGGSDGTLALLQDRETLDFLAKHGKTARYVTSVCTGSLVLGAAGLLRGYRATSHWVVRDQLALWGATPVAERVVQDRNRITGAGVTAGLDLAVHLASLLRNDKYARALELNFEYDPQPPFRAGTPAEAGEEITGMLSAIYSPFVEKARAIALSKTARSAS